MSERLDPAHGLEISLAGLNRFLERRASFALSKSVLNFAFPRGNDLERRTEDYHDWVDARRELGVWPYHRVMLSPVGNKIVLADAQGQGGRPLLNFGSQDYLGLAQDPRVLDAAHAAIDDDGVHSAGSPVLGGRPRHLLALEQVLCGALHAEACTFYPSGWMAGFGLLAGLVRKDDAVVMDALSHNCLQEGARHNTERVRKFQHNDLDDLAQKLREERARDAAGGLFVIIESLYSMDSDSPDLRAIIELVRRYDGILIVDVAHDFGSMGDRGLGLLETVPLAEGPDLVVGSFSKTFGCNGGFVASSARVREYLSFHSPCFAFSNGISPVQTRVAYECARIAFSEEGNDLRDRLRHNIDLLRRSMVEQGLEVGGDPSPIVPVFVGEERLARMTSHFLEVNGLRANLVEFPGVPKGKARFRYQMMASHTDADIRQAARIMRHSREQAAAAGQELGVCS